MSRSGTGPTTGRDGAQHGRPHLDLDLDESLSAAHPAQHDPATGSRRDVARAPARHVLAPHRLACCGEGGQVRGGLGAVAPAHCCDETEYRGRQRDQGGDGDRSPHGCHTAIVGRAPGRAGTDGAQEARASHGPAPPT
jgi:hypothetical protein